MRGGKPAFRRGARARAIWTSTSIKLGLIGLQTGAAWAVPLSDAARLAKSRPAMARALVGACSTGGAYTPWSARSLKHAIGLMVPCLQHSPGQVDEESV